MALDDLVPDSALIARLRALQAALDSLVGVARLRKHLPQQTLTNLTNAMDLMGKFCQSCKKPA